MFDIVLVDDVEPARLVLTMGLSGRVHADLHEYFPRLHDEVPAWNKVRRPYFEWLIRQIVGRVGSATTVGAGIADEYRRVFGLECGVVTNASPAQRLSPSAVGSTIRIVHSGVAQPSRQLEIVMRGVAAATTDVSLDLFLMANDTIYLAQLKELAGSLGDRVTIRDPLPQRDLVKALNAFDVGIHVLPATSFNNTNALPNKFFDYVQARLGLIIGPSPEMVRILDEYRFGAVTEGFTAADVERVVNSLTSKRVTEWKRHADEAATTLSSERQVEVWKRAIARLAAA
jgi:hypothetical protein